MHSNAIPALEQTFSDYSEWGEQQIVDSAIALDVALLNIRDEDGAEAVEEVTEHETARLQNQHSYVNKRTAKLLSKYDPILQGRALSMPGVTMDGEREPIAYVKPQFPRMAQKYDGLGNPTGKVKAVKVETPSGFLAVPILPDVPEDRAIAILAKHGIERDPSKPLYRQIQAEIAVPMLLGEGGKKVYSVVSHDVFAVGLRSATCWGHKESGEFELHDKILELTDRPGRPVYIGMDQDDVASTRRKIEAQIRKGGKRLQARGCKVFVMIWDPSEGKGIDDVLKAAIDPEARLQQLIATAMPFELWLKAGCKERTFKALEIASQLPAHIKPIKSEGRYLPDLNIRKKLNFISAPTGAGKSRQLRKILDDRRSARAWDVDDRQRITLIITPTNTVGQQNAVLLSFPHRHDYASGKEWVTAVRAAGGGAVCYNSLILLSDELIDLRVDALVLDEVVQGLDGVADGATMKDRQSEVLDKLIRLMQRADLILCAEAAIQPRAIELVQDYSGEADLDLFLHKQTENRGHCRISPKGGLSGLLYQAVRDLLSGKKIAWATDSLLNSRIVARYLESLGFKVLRLDSETNALGQNARFADDPDNAINDSGADALIYSPVLKTGISIDLLNHFNGVYAYFTHLAPSACLQMLTRVRDGIKREVYCPQQMPSYGDEATGTIESIARDIGASIPDFLRIYQMEAPLLDPETVASRAALVRYHCAAINQAALEKSFAAECLGNLLEAENFTVEHYDRIGDAAISDDLKKLKRQIEWEDAERLAQAVPMASVAAAEKALKGDLSSEDRAAALKTLYMEEFPGLDLNNPNVCLRAIVAKKGASLKGVRLQSSIKYADLTVSQTREVVAAALTSGLYHKIPKAGLRAKFLHTLGIARLLEDRDRVFTGGEDDLMKIYHLLIEVAAQARQILGIKIQDQYIDAAGKIQNSPIEIVGKVLRLLRLTFACTSHRGKDGQRYREYKIVPMVSTGLSKEERAIEWEKTWEVRDQMMAAADLKAEQTMRKIADQARDRAKEAEAQAAIEAPPDPDAPWSPVVGARVLVSHYGRKAIGIIKALPGLVKKAWIVDVGVDLMVWESSELFPA